MAEFSAAASLSLSLPSSETQRVRDQIERELADIEVGTAAPTGGGRASAAAPGSMVSDGGGGMSRMLTLAETRNELLEEIAEAGVGGGGLGPGSGFLAARALRTGGPAAGGLSLLSGLSLAARAAGAGVPLMATGPGGVRTAAPGSESLAPGGPDDPAGQLVASFMERTFNQATGGGPLVDVKPSDLIGDPLDIGEGDLIGDTAEITADDILPNISITKQDILDALFGGGGGGDNTTTTTRTDPTDTTTTTTTNDRPPKPDCGIGRRAVWNPHNRAWRCAEVADAGSGGASTTGPRMF